MIMMILLLMMMMMMMIKMNMMLLSVTNPLQLGVDEPVSHRVGDRGQRQHRPGYKLILQVILLEDQRFVQFNKYLTNILTNSGLSQRQRGVTIWEGWR